MALQTQKSPPVVELMRYKLLQGTSKDLFLLATRIMQEGFLHHQPGFIRRLLSVEDDGTWTDILFWENDQLAIRARKAAVKSRFTEGYLALIDRATFHLKTRNH